MINNGNIICMGITVALALMSIVVPFVTVYFLSRKKETGMWSSAGLGLLGQFWSQHLLPYPILWILTMFGWFMTIYNSDSYYVAFVLITSLILSVLAALGRLWSVWLMNKHIPSLYRAICVGLGFAGVKVFSLVLSYISYIQHSRAINNMGLEAFKESMLAGNTTLTSESVDNLINQLTSVSSYSIIMEGVNMIFIVAVEVALSILIYEGLIRKKFWRATAIAAAINYVYTVVGTIIGALSSEKMGNILSKSNVSLLYAVYVFIWGLAAIWFIYGAVKRYQLVLAEGPYAHYAYFEKED